MLQTRFYFLILPTRICFSFIAPSSYRQVRNETSWRPFWQTSMPQVRSSVQGLYLYHNHYFKIISKNFHGTTSFLRANRSWGVRCVPFSCERPVACTVSMYLILVIAVPSCCCNVQVQRWSSHQDCTTDIYTTVATHSGLPDHTDCPSTAELQLLQHGSECLGNSCVALLILFT